MTDNLPIPTDDPAPLQTDKCLQELSSYIDSKFSDDPPSLENILADYPYLEKLGQLTLNVLQSLINKGLTDESFNTIEYALRTLIYDKVSLDVSNLKSQISLNSIKSMSNSSLSSASSSPYAVKSETAQEIRRLSKDIQMYKDREIELENNDKLQKDQIAQLSNENDKLKSLLNDRKSQSDGQYCNMQTDLISLNDEIDRLKENLTFAQNREKNLHDEIDELNQTIEVSSKKISSLQGIISDKKKKLSNYKLNESKLKKEIQNEKLNSAKLQAELEALTHLHGKDQNQDSLTKNTKFTEALDKFRNILNEKEVENAFLRQQLEQLKKYSGQLIDISLEYQDRLSMAEEDKSVNMTQIQELKDEIRSLSEENLQKENELQSIQSAYKKLREYIEKIEKEFNLPIEKIDLKSINQGQETKNSSDRITELEKIISSLLIYLNQLMIGNGGVYPLICRSEPILEDQFIRESIIKSISDLKVSISLTNSESQIPSMLDNLLTDNDTIQNLLDDLQSKLKYTEYAAISVLCSANNNIRAFLESTAESAHAIYKEIPNEYKKSDVFQSINNYVSDCRELFGTIFEVIHNSTIFHSDEFLFSTQIKDFVNASSDLIHNLEVEVKPLIHFKGELSEMPNAIADFIEAKIKTIEKLKEEAGENTFVSDKFDSFDNTTIKSRGAFQMSALEDQNTSLLQKIDSQSKDFNEKIANLQEELKSEKSKNELLEHQLELAEQNLRNMQKGKDDLLNKAKIVEKERDDLLELLNRQKKNFAERQKAILENERNNFDALLRRIKKRFQSENDELNQIISEKDDRIKKLKDNYSKMEAMYETQISYQSSKIVDLISNVRATGEKAAKQIEEKEKRHEIEIKRLEEKVNKLLSISPAKRNDESTEMLDSSIVDAQEAVKTGQKNELDQSNISSIFLSPKKSAAPEALNLNIPENITTNSPSNSARALSSRTPECDRFVQQVGRALSKYTNDEGPWTRSRILAAIPRLFSRLGDLDKISPQSSAVLTPTVVRNRSSSYMSQSKVTPVRQSSSNMNNTELDQNKPPLKIASAINEQKEWKNWAADLAMRMNLPPLPPQQLRVELKDIFLATNAKSCLVKMITSLREQKRIFKSCLDEDSPLNSPKGAEQNKKNLKLNHFILMLRFISIDKKIAKRAALVQQHAKIPNSPKFILQASPKPALSQI